MHIHMHNKLTHTKLSCTIRLLLCECKWGCLGIFNKYINTHTNTHKYSHLSPVKIQSNPEGQAVPSLCLKLLSPWQQAAHRFTLHHLGETESMQSWKEMKEREWTREDKEEDESDGETDGERNAGLNDKNKERLRSNVEAEWCERLSRRKRHEKRGCPLVIGSKVKQPIKAGARQAGQD